MINDILERIFLGSDINTSRDDVKGRLKLVLAHDRANLTPEMLEAMRKDILAVVSRYVELDPEGLDVSLESDQRATALIANLPIRRIKAQTPSSPSQASAPPQQLQQLPQQQAPQQMSQSSQQAPPPQSPQSPQPQP